MEFKGGATNAVHAWESAKVDQARSFAGDVVNAN